ncbi:hypothetical protein RMB02_02860 [Acinetobacter sp. V91_13]|nr:hypothetical protein [Acinetobacter sp. V91_4B]MDS8025969.1 hypothetical protein [Acinetobacter sp. V91_13]
MKLHVLYGNNALVKGDLVVFTSDPNTFEDYWDGIVFECIADSYINNQGCWVLLEGISKKINCKNLSKINLEKSIFPDFD